MAESGPAGADDTPPDFVRSVGRALRLLEIVAASDGLPVKAIARRAGLNLSTTYHLLGTLAYEGYLRRLHDGVYVAGPQVAHRFYDVLATYETPPGARHLLTTLTARTGHTSYLGRLHRGRTLIVDLVEGPRSPHLEDLERGLDASVHATALGKALLLTMCPTDRAALVREQGLRPFTPTTPRTVEELETELLGLRTGDVVVEHGAYRSGVSCAARGLAGPPGGAAWALVISARGEVREAARRELASAAARLERRLVHTGP